MNKQNINDLKDKLKNKPLEKDRYGDTDRDIVSRLFYAIGYLERQNNELSELLLVISGENTN